MQIVIKVDRLYTARCDDTVSNCMFHFAWERHTPTIARVDWSAPSAGLLSITGKLRGHWASQVRYVYRMMRQQIAARCDTHDCA